VDSQSTENKGCTVCRVVSGATSTDIENTQYQGVVSSVLEKDCRESRVVVVSGATSTDIENTQYQGMVSSVLEKDCRESMVAG